MDQVSNIHRTGIESFISINIFISGKGQKYGLRPAAFSFHIWPINRHALIRALRYGVTADLAISESFKVDQVFSHAGDSFFDGALTDEWPKRSFLMR
ncbi:hypothetical protein GOA77_07450 [Sinorhizobium meliloti]|uniref:Uncharacterized protein n=2 Tax=Rhizobium meliloti TaxID=382 RepID=A0A6A7ZMP1_RHIML|nr:hypothetical protein SM11_pC1280 [Sinorhizobium meliloti SM11]ARS66883.1 hypothetical protein SMRU11_06280 [Sinorhizobium meliloti RU11/001]MDW9390954.1 hypothetical protein [Sinorhizobium meliloti]MDW9436122.1 hypothetical protein [Sinorhizobium meliloti]MDW9461286.1 hypothetical protein [Sinorhizobium meliloti]